MINCIGPEIKETTIIQSIKFWEKRGHNILFYEYEPQLEICKTSYYSLDGFIILRKEDKVIKELDEGVLASTYRKLIFSEIKSSEIIFSEGSYNYSLLLEHEMGHAFGYGHISKLGYLMNPYYGLMGDKF